MEISADQIPRYKLAADVLGVMAILIGGWGLVILPGALFLNVSLVVAALGFLFVGLAALVARRGLLRGTRWGYWLGWGIALAGLVGLPVALWPERATIGDWTIWIWWGVIWFYFACLGFALLNPGSPSRKPERG